MDQNIRQPVVVEMQLQRSSDLEGCDSIWFTYEPEDPGKNLVVTALLTLRCSNATVLLTELKVDVPYNCFAHYKVFRYNCVTHLKVFQYNSVIHFKYNGVTHYKYNCVTHLKVFHYNCVNHFKVFQYNCITHFKYNCVTHLNLGVPVFQYVTHFKVFQYNCVTHLKYNCVTHLKLGVPVGVPCITHLKVFQYVTHFKAFKLSSAYIEHVKDCLSDPGSIVKGGYGTVYISRLEVDGFRQRIVLKELSVDDSPGSRRKDKVHILASVTNEKLASRVMHFAIVPLIAYHDDLEKGKYYFIAPYLEKGDLYAAIQSDRKLLVENPPPAEYIPVLHWKHRLKIMYQIACAIDYLHTGNSFRYVFRRKLY
ncbi:hypothetical protein DPMN_154177 [Dreissena polymorpha]|uniref:Protein kinase domain-containing protein n=1 Tax=Dreissena polymorpha TaxID=45954 RepID=A0A9D4FJZ0_DREPO|nr:hypothetical protein DPMN_154177 [Dreissena polymorpha]